MEQKQRYTNEEKIAYYEKRLKELKAKNDKEIRKSLATETILQQIQTTLEEIRELLKQEGG